MLRPCKSKRAWPRSDKNPETIVCWLVNTRYRTSVNSFVSNSPLVVRACAPPCAPKRASVGRRIEAVVESEEREAAEEEEEEARVLREWRGWGEI